MKTLRAAVVWCVLVGTVASLMLYAFDTGHPAPSTFHRVGSYDVSNASLSLPRSMSFALARCLSHHDCAPADYSALGTPCTSAPQQHDDVALFVVVQDDSPSASHMGHAQNLLQFVFEAYRDLDLHSASSVTIVVVSRTGRTPDWFNRTFTALFGGHVTYLYAAEPAAHWPFYQSAASYYLEYKSMLANGTASVRFVGHDFNGELRRCFSRVVVPRRSAWMEGVLQIADAEFIHRQFFGSASAPVPTDPESPGPRVLYLHREPTNRGIANDAEFVACLRELSDHVVVRDDALPHEVRAADVVIGMHGAGLVNTMFMRRGAVLVEMFPLNIPNRTHFAAMMPAQWRHYVRWHNDDPGRHIWTTSEQGDNDSQTIVPCEVVQQLWSRAAALIDLNKRVPDR